MLTMKALAVMLLWTIAMVSIFNYVGFPNHHGELLWSIGGAIFLVITLIGNVWIFIDVSKEEPWDWVKNSDGESE